jgi:hydroxymethylpyrimidine kinase/phosphomethylpyrimidine kinase/thiamine-phosphate diphosphorylase
MKRRPIIWSIAGTDSGGGAGLAADQRAADASGVHLCPVVAAVTAQHSRAVTHIEPLAPELLDAQLAALADDMPPAVIKTGLLGGAEQVRTVARWVDRMRADRPVALVVDPVLGATTGASFAATDTVVAYRDDLLPRATLVTPNRREALALLGRQETEADAGAMPALAEALRGLGPRAVCITGGDSPGGLALDWISTPEARGWLALPRIDTPHHHGTGCTFATSAAAALALGFVAPDALVLAKMATAHALRSGYAAGAGAGPVHALPGYALDPTLMPYMSWDETPRVPALVGPAGEVPAHRPLDLYAIVDSAARMQEVLACGIRTVQLRIKTPAQPAAAWHAGLRQAVQVSVDACRKTGAVLFVNDHWQLARELGAPGVHLGQEDLLALGDAGRAALAASGLALGVSSHSLWELARARSLSPRYIACGPVWPTLTKAMPWRAQGLDNLAWWRHMAGVPVVAIGGILDAGQVREAARCGVDGVCVVRALGERPAERVEAMRAALVRGRGEPGAPVPPLPHPSLDNGL